MERKCNLCNIPYILRETFCSGIPTSLGEGFLCSYKGEREIMDKTIKLLDSTIEFLDDLDLLSLFETFYAYIYLYQSDVFSINGFSYETEVLEYKDMFYLNLLEGPSCCRHIADFYRLLLGRLDKNYKPLFIRGYSGIYSNDFNPRRQNTIGDYLGGIETYLSALLSDKKDPYSVYNYGNHCTVHVVRDGEVILLDPLNSYAFSYDKRHDYAKMINGTGRFNITGAIVGGRSDLTKRYLLEYLKYESRKTSNLDEELEDAFYRVTNKLDFRKDLIRDFSYEIYDSLEELTALKRERLSLHM